MLPQVKKLGELALNLVFPQRCLGCGKEGSFICTPCQHTLSYIMPPICPLCGRPQASGILCSSCVSWRSNIDGIRSPFRFEGVIRQAVYQLKYRNLRAAAPFLAGMLDSYIETYPVPGDVLVPVPLHKKRMKYRGYNQSQLLAGELSALTGLPVEDELLIKHANTGPQAWTKNVEERQKNVSQAFSCTSDDLSGKRIILIDDVSTSGATLDSCARVLKESGAGSVWGLTLAREI